MVSEVPYYKNPFVYLEKHTPLLLSKEDFYYDHDILTLNLSLG